MTINFQLSTTQQRNQCINQEGSISNNSRDQTTTLVSEIANMSIASAACSQSSSVGSKNKEVAFKIFERNQVDYQKLCIKASGKDSDLLKEEMNPINLVTPLPDVLQKGECITILDLLREKFPLLTKSLSKKETEIPRFVVSSLNHESKPNPLLQIQAKGEIAFIAWDSSSSQLAKKEVKKGFKKDTCDIPFGLEKKVTLIGILIAEPLNLLEPLLARKAAYHFCDSDSDEDNCRYIRKLPYIGKDRQKKIGETLHPFCLEIIPQRSSSASSGPEN